MTRTFPEALLPDHMLDRFTDFTLIESGSQGEVWRAYDEAHTRFVAVKVLRPDAKASARRFRREVRLSAMLDHPNILPIQDSDSLNDASRRPFMIMRYYEGAQTLDVAFKGGAVDELQRRRRVSAIHRAATAVGHAHQRGIVHRDIKPQNIIVVAETDVYVIDWGLAREFRRAHDEPEDVEDTWEEPAQATGYGDRTAVGAVGGSPAWMSPEAARGGFATLTPAADVYGLCATLYHLLTGAPPFPELDAARILSRLVMESPPELPRSEPEALREIVGKGMRRDPSARHPDATALAEELARWLDGVERRERAQRIVAETDALAERARDAAREAATLSASGQAALSKLPTWAPETERAPHWRTLAEAAARRKEADEAELTIEQQLRAALELAPDLQDTRSRLARLYKERVEEAERDRKPELAARAEALLRATDIGEHARFIKGDGTVTLITDPPGATVIAYRYVERDRRLVEERHEELGQTPLREVSLPRGSYMLRVNREGYEEVRYPVHIGRGELWDGVAPDESEPTPIWLPPRGALGPDEVYVPAGWFLAGDPEARNGFQHARLWVDGFVMSRFPITCGHYLDFMNDLLRCGVAATELQSLAPTNAASYREQAGTAVIQLGDDGFRLVPDREGDVWQLDWPILLVDHPSAVRFTKWRAARDSHPWRLPWEIEWEKAARGVDGRTFPWGSHDESIFACVSGS
ncbi:protein kinase, partial [Myxococcota bacterium]|nr:protein kinase [Myxococcota bacterium]